MNITKFYNYENVHKTDVPTLQVHEIHAIKIEFSTSYLFIWKPDYYVLPFGILRMLISKFSESFFFKKKIFCQDFYCIKREVTFIMTFTSATVGL